MSGKKRLFNAPGHPSTVEEFYALRNEYGTFLLGEANEIAEGDGAIREILFLVAIQFILTSVDESTLKRWDSHRGKNGGAQDAPLRVNFLSRVFIWGAFVFQILIGFRSTKWFRPRIPSELFDEIFVSTEESGPANKRLFQYMDSLRANKSALWLNLRPGRDTRPRSVHDGRVVECRPWCWRDLPAAARRYARVAPKVGMLLERVRPVYRPRAWIRCVARSYRNLVRGFWFAETSEGLEIPRTARCVFSLLKLDAAILEQALRHRGLSTVHWLHGTVEMRHHFSGFAEWCVTMTPADAEVRNAFGFYRRVTCPAPIRRVKYEEGPSEGGVLLLTNLLHPNHRLPESLRFASFERLLEVMRESGEPVTWRPHPEERKSPRYATFVKAAQKAEISISPGGPLPDEIRAHRWNVCTFSGVIGDVLEAGRLPFIWADAPYERIGLWAKIPVETEFRNLLEWKQIRDLSTGEKEAIFTQMEHSWGIGIPSSLPAGFFRDLPK